MWVRAVWREDDAEEEGVIPEIWIQGKTVRWPTGLNAIKAFNEQRVPLDKWHKFPLIKIKFRSADKELCEEYEFTTAPETSDGDGTDSDVVQSNRGKENNDPLRLPTPPTKFTGRHPQQPSYSTPKSSSKTSKSASTTRCSGSETPKNGSRFSRPTTSRGNKSARSPRRSRSRSLRRSRSRSFRLSRSPSPPICYNSRDKEGYSDGRGQGSNHNFPEPVGQSQGSSKSHQNDKSSNVFPMSDGRFQKRVLHLLTEIRNTLHQVGQRCEPKESALNLTQATDLDQFHALENSLVDLETKKLLLSRVEKIGGANLKENVRNVMNRLMTNTVMAKMNMDGNGGKIAFRKTVLYQVITEGVLRNQQATEHDVTDTVLRLLKYAPDRKGGGGRKEQQ